MEKQRKLILIKKLPNCPKGRIFKEDINGNFYYSMTDEEVIEGKLKMYNFTKEEVINNPKWFLNTYAICNK
jgi:hypothetical protein